MGARKISYNTLPKQQTLALTSQLRQELKKPLGTLIKGSPAETMKQLKQLIIKEKPTRIISVGDVVTKNMTKHNIPVDVIIVDNRVMREKIEPIRVTAKQTVHVKNPPGTLTPESWTTIEEAIKRKSQTRVLVDGEEDLLTLVAILSAPQNSLVIYGQPHQGIVTVKVNKRTREKIRRIVEAMEQFRKAKMKEGSSETQLHGS